jgi:hypothetical protein
MSTIRGQQVAPRPRETDPAELWAPRRRSLAFVRRRRRNARSATALVASCAVLALVATTVGAEQAQRTPPVKSGTIIWAGRVFTTPRQLELWLRSRGVDYSQWVDRHPGAAVAQRRPEPVVPQRSDSARRVVVITRAIVVTLLVIVGYLMLPVRLSFRRLIRRPRFSG